MSRADSYDLQSLKDQAADIIRKIRENEDPQVLTDFRKLYKKAVPFFMRDYVAAYLFRSLASGGRMARPASPARTRSLFVSVGKNKRVFPKDLIGFLCNEGDIQRGDIGEIKILESYSFVAVDEAKADALIAKLDGTLFRGRKITVNNARKKEDSSEN